MQKVKTVLSLATTIVIKMLLTDYNELIISIISTVFSIYIYIFVKGVSLALLVLPKETFAMELVVKSC